MTMTMTMLSQVTSLSNIQMSSVTCGESHTAALSVGGQLYTFGDGRWLFLLFFGSNSMNCFRINLFVCIHFSQAWQTVPRSWDNNEPLLPCLCVQVILITWSKIRVEQPKPKIINKRNHQNYSNYNCRFRGFTVTKAVCGGCHTMVLGVPIPDFQVAVIHWKMRWNWIQQFDPFQDSQSTDLLYNPKKLK